MSEPRAVEAESTGTEPPRQWRLVASGAAVAVLIALVVLAARSSSPPSGRGDANAGPIIAIVHAIEIGGIAIELVAILILIVVFRLARRRDEEDEDQTYHEPVRTHWLVRLLSSLLPLLLVTALIVAITRTHPIDQPLALAPFGGAGASPGGGGLAGQVMANLGLGWWEVLIAVVLAVVAFVAILRAFHEPALSPRDEPEERRKTGALATAITAGLHDARREPDPRRAVIAAYATLERMLAAQGFPRREVEAPLEYMSRLFSRRRVRSDDLATLTELFELARFSQHLITPATKERAIAALTALEQELQAAP